MQNLREDFSKRENELVSTKEKINDTEYNLSLIDLKILSEQGRMLQNDIANIEKQIAQFEFEKKKANDEIEKAREEIRDIAIELSQLNNERTNLTMVLTMYNEEKRKADEEYVKLEVDFKFSEDNYNSTITTQNII